MRGARLVVGLAVCAALTACSQQRPRHGAGGAAASMAAPAAVPAGATLANPKIAPALAAVARRVRAAATGAAAAARSTPTVHVDAAGEIQAYVHVTRLGSTVERALTAAGAKVERASAALGVYQVWASPAALERIAALPTVTRITPPAYGFTRPGARAPAT